MKLFFVFSLVVSELGAAQFGVVVLPRYQKDTRLADRAAVRLVRRIEEQTGDRGMVIPRRDFNGVYRKVQRDGLDRLKALLSSPGESGEKAFELTQSFDSLTGRGQDGITLQEAALKIAILNRHNPPLLEQWIETALKLHPNLELADGAEWEEGVNFPEIGFQISQSRKKLTNQCRISIDKLNTKPNGVQITLNGFPWSGGSLGHEGPFWLRAERGAEAIERWVSCGNETVRLKLVPKELGGGELTQLMRNLDLNELFVALEGRGVFLYRISSSGNVVLLLSLNSTDSRKRAEPWQELIETSGNELPLKLKNREIEGLTYSAENVGVAKDSPSIVGPKRWYTDPKNLWWIGSLAVGAVTLKVTGVMDTRQTEVKGIIE